jgi:hypothetical protein
LGENGEQEADEATDGDAWRKPPSPGGRRRDDDDARRRKQHEAQRTHGVPDGVVRLEPRYGGRVVEGVTGLDLREKYHPEASSPEQSHPRVRRDAQLTEQRALDDLQSTAD